MGDMADDALAEVGPWDMDEQPECDRCTNKLTAWQYNSTRLCTPCWTLDKALFRMDLAACVAGLLSQHDRKSVMLELKRVRKTKRRE